jgi:anhydro-N-acetylmuramic acid kinase
MPSKDRLLALGLMSGTSCDGVDAALVETDGRSAITCGSWLSEPYDAAFHDRLRSVLGGRGNVAAVERELTERHAQAVRDLLARQRIAPGTVDVIGFHGQTILHEPERGRTWQIGDGALLAGLTGIDVVNDFRSADVAAGGQGAPFVPLFHAALAAALPRPLAVLNIGGVANVTWIGEDGVDGELIAFDTGPGNAMLNDWALRHTGRPADIGGVLAAGGRVDAGALSALLTNPYFQRPAPKSLDRDAFDAAPLERLSAADGAATLVAFTAAAVAQSQTLFPRPVNRWLVAGGGRHNPAIMAALAQRLEAAVAPVEAVGWDGDALEAQAFAYLAVRSLRGLPLSVPTTTGVLRPMTGGTVHRAIKNQ